MRSLDLVNTAAAIIHSHIQTIDKEKSFVKSSNHIEHIHQMRVAARRLRTSLGIFIDIFPKNTVESFRDDLRNLGRSLSKARELDVQIQFLESIKPDNISFRIGIKRLLILLKGSRQKCQKNILEAIELLDKKNTLENLNNALISVSGPEKTFPRVIFVKRINQILLKRFKELKTYGRAIVLVHNARELHLLRIAAKKLRYSLEVLDSFYRGKFKHSVQQAKSIQDILGDIHEYDVWIETIPNIAKQQAANSNMGSACQFLVDHCEKSRLTRYREFITLWKKLKEGDFFFLDLTLGQVDAA